MGRARWRRRRRRIGGSVVAGPVVGALLVVAAASCTSVRSDLGTSDSSCYLALPTATKAVHGHGHLAGVHRYTLATLRKNAPGIYGPLDTADHSSQVVCVVAFKGQFSGGLRVRSTRPILGVVGGRCHDRTGEPSPRDGHLHAPSHPLRALPHRLTTTGRASTAERTVAVAGRRLSASRFTARWFTARSSAPSGYAHPCGFDREPRRQRYERAGPMARVRVGRGRESWGAAGWHDVRPRGERPPAGHDRRDIRRRHQRRVPGQ